MAAASADVGTIWRLRTGNGQPCQATTGCHAPVTKLPARGSMSAGVLSPIVRVGLHIHDRCVREMRAVRETGRALFGWTMAEEPYDDRAAGPSLDLAAAHRGVTSRHPQMLMLFRSRPRRWPQLPHPQLRLRLRLRLRGKLRA